MIIDIPVRRVCRSLGFDIERRRPVLVDLLRQHEVDLVLDVGANVGQFAHRLRAWGYRGRIVSFEPLTEPLATLERAAAADARWDVLGVALGETDGEASINVAEGSSFSSLLPSRPELHAIYPGAVTVRTQPIVLRRLDTMLDTVRGSARTPFLKVDAQGYEASILRGAMGVLGQFWGAQLEVSLTPLYDGEATLTDIVGFMEGHGFVPALMEPVNHDPRSGALLQVDCIFTRRRQGEAGIGPRGVP